MTERSRHGEKLRKSLKNQAYQHELNGLFLFFKYSAMGQKKGGREKDNKDGLNVNEDVSLLKSH